MSIQSQGRSTATTSSAGVLIALSGLLVLLAFLDAGGRPAFIPVATIALAAGAVLLAAGSGGGTVVGRSRVGRIALVLFGAAPLGFQLSPALHPWSVAVGMSLTWLATVATVVAAVAVARAGVLRGVGGWVLAIVAIDAVLTALMSSVLLGDLPLLYLAWHLELVRPIALLVWGVSVALHGWWPALRTRGAALNDDWRRTTDVGGADQPAAERASQG